MEARRGVEGVQGGPPITALVRVELLRDFRGENCLHWYLSTSRLKEL